jgi:hypothetical protein
MIDRAHPLPVSRQVKLVGISRSSAYYAPSPIGAADLALMRRIDELHLEHPFAGARMLMRLLKREGIGVGRKHVGTLMRKMGIEALYRKPNLSRKHPAHKIWPYLLRDRKIAYSTQREQPFHVKVNRNSTAKRTRIPRHREQAERSDAGPCLFTRTAASQSIDCASCAAIRRRA